MSKVLSILLDKPEQIIKDAIKELEELSGFPSEDVRLIADNGLMVRRKISELGLDPDDTTNEELYQALLARFAHDAAQLDLAIGSRQDLNLDRKIDLAIDLTKHLLSKKEVWVLKPTAAKRLLQALPPKKLMKLLNYRSVDSLLKRQPLAEIYLAVSFIESPTWNKSLNKSASDLNTTDWTRQPPDLVKLPIKCFQLLPEPASFTIASSLTGTAALWPAAKLEKASVLNLSLLLAEAAEILGATSEPRAMANLHPALNWWSNTTHLLATHSGEPVSLNLKDLAISHLQAADYKTRSMSHARESLWDELLRRYQNYVSQDVEILSKFTNEIGLNTRLSRASFLPAKLAQQYVEA